MTYLTSIDLETDPSYVAVAGSDSHSLDSPVLGFQTCDCQTHGLVSLFLKLQPPARHTLI